MSVSVAPLKCSASISRWNVSSTIRCSLSSTSAAQKRPKASSSDAMASPGFGQLVDFGEGIAGRRRRLVGLLALPRAAPAVGIHAFEQPRRRLPGLVGGAGDDRHIARLAL